MAQIWINWIVYYISHTYNSTLYNWNHIFYFKYLIRCHKKDLLFGLLSKNRKIFSSTRKVNNIEGVILHTPKKILKYMTWIYNSIGLLYYFNIAIAYYFSLTHINGCRYFAYNNFIFKSLLWFAWSRKKALDW